MDDDNSIPVNNKIHRSYADSSSESAFIGSWSSSSSSSFLNASFDSNDVDLDSNGDFDDNDEFIAQLTRQMTDYMLDDNEVNCLSNGVNGYPKHLNSNLHKPNFQESRRSYADTVKKSITGFEPEQTLSREKPLQQPQIQMYQVENQPRVSGTSGAGGASRLRGKKNESVTQQQQQQMMKQSNNRGVRNGVHGSGPVIGSGMRAIFLNGSGTRNVTSGTGVFLPRSPTDATDHSRKKLGCSTVLVPTRVLQALEQHFINRESLSPSKSFAQTHSNHHVKDDTSQPQESVSASVDNQESKLPQDWIY